MRVENYELFSGITGRKIRTATRVVLTDGSEINFMERMSKREAIRQTTIELARRSNGTAQ